MDDNYFGFPKNVRVDKLIVQKIYIFLSSAPFSTLIKGEEGNRIIQATYCNTDMYLHRLASLNKLIIYFECHQFLDTNKLMLIYFRPGMYCCLYLNTPYT